MTSKTARGKSCVSSEMRMATCATDDDVIMPSAVAAAKRSGQRRIGCSLPELRQRHRVWSRTIWRSAHCPSRLSSVAPSLFLCHCPKDVNGFNSSGRLERIVFMIRPLGYLAYTFVPVPYTRGVVPKLLVSVYTTSTSPGFGRVIALRNAIRIRGSVHIVDLAGDTEDAQCLGHQPCKAATGGGRDRLWTKQKPSKAIIHVSRGKLRNLGTEGVAIDSIGYVDQASSLGCSRTGPVQPGFGKFGASMTNALAIHPVDLVRAA